MDVANGVQVEEGLIAKLEENMVPSINSVAESVKQRFRLMIGSKLKTIDLEKYPRYADENYVFSASHVPVLIISKPGIGKTTALHKAAIELSDEFAPYNIKVGYKQIVFGQTEVGDFTGAPIPINGEVQRVRSDDLPTVERDGEYGILFLDEVTTADQMQVQPALSLTDERRAIGTYKLPDGWVVVAAGNGPDCTNFRRLDLATISRCETFVLPDPDYEKDWKPWARDHNINDIILSFLDMYPQYIYNEEESESMGDYENPAAERSALPRTWELLSINIDRVAWANNLEPKIAYGRTDCLSPKMLNQIGVNVIGVEAAGQLEQFCVYAGECPIDILGILAGTEQDVKHWRDQLNKAGNWHKDQMFYLLEQGTTILCNELRKLGGIATPEFIDRLVHYVNWFMDLNDPDSEEQDVCVILYSQLISPHTADDTSIMQNLSAIARAPEVRCRFKDFDDFVVDNIDSIATNSGFAI